MALVNAGTARQLASPLSPPEAMRMLLFRNMLAYRRAWYLFLTGFLEPVFYLFSIGVGVGQLVGGFTVGGEAIEYAAFVAPGMLAASAMNGTLMDSTFNFFFKLKYNKVFEHMLATPLSTGDIARGELSWSLLRGGIYATGFLLVMVAMDLVSSWWAVLAVPGALLVAFAFGGAGMAITTFMRSWQHFEWVTLLTLPMFLFSATFFPVDAYPGAVRWLVEATPLYRGVVLLRGLCTGTVGWEALVSVGYLAAMGAVGLMVCRRRLGTLLLR